MTGDERSAASNTFRTLAACKRHPNFPEVAVHLFSCRQLLLLSLATLFTAQAAAQQSLVVVSFGGDTKKREEWAFYAPFEASSGVKVTSVDYNGGNAQLAAQV